MFLPAAQNKKHGRTAGRLRTAAQSYGRRRHHGGCLVGTQSVLASSLGHSLLARLGHISAVAHAAKTLTEPSALAAWRPITRIQVECRQPEDSVAAINSC